MKLNGLLHFLPQPSDIFTQIYLPYLWHFATLGHRFVARALGAPFMLAWSVSNHLYRQVTIQSLFPHIKITATDIPKLWGQPIQQAEYEGVALIIGLCLHQRSAPSKPFYNWKTCFESYRPDKPASFLSISGKHCLILFSTNETARVRLVISPDPTLWGAWACRRCFGVRWLVGRGGACWCQLWVDFGLARLKWRHTLELSTSLSEPGMACSKSLVLIASLVGRLSFVKHT